MPSIGQNKKTGTTPPLKTFTDYDESNSSDSLKNTEKLKGKEVVQMYSKDEIGSVTRPDKEWKGFVKIELIPDESKVLKFTITPKMVAFAGLKMEKIVEAGEYTIMVGTSSKEDIKTKFKLNK